MNGSMRKALVAAAALVCTAGAVWANGDQDAGASKAGPAKKLTITVANYQMEPTPDDAELLIKYGQKFGVTFKPVNINHDKYHELLNVKLAAGEVPDFLYIRQAETLGTYVKQGVIAPLSEDMVKKNAPDLYKAINDLYPGAFELGKVDGVLYGIPALNRTNIFHIPLVYRADWMKKVGVAKVPETLAEFETLMYKFAKEDPDGNGKNDTYGLSKDGFMAVLGAFGVMAFDDRSPYPYWMEKKGKIINDTTSPEARQALELLAKWYKDGIIDPEFITGENQGGYWAISHAFINGRIGFTSRANYYHWAMPGVYDDIDANGNRTPCQPGAVAKELIALNPKAELVLGQSLKGPNGAQGIKQFNLLMNFYCVGKLAEKEPGKVAKVLEIYNHTQTSDVLERLSIKNGQEGKYWKLLDPATETWNFIPPYDKDQSYWSRIGGILSMPEAYPPKAMREQWAYSLKYDQKGIANAIQVGLPNMRKYQAELKKISDEAYIAIITGAKPVSYFDDFVKNYQAAGGAEAEKEANDYIVSQKKK